MITFFATGKPFLGHSGIIQRNALKSWALLHPDAEVILFGDEPGAHEVAHELSIRHEPHVECNEHGTKRLDYLLSKAQEIARYDVLCYLNCDILLTADFWEALQIVRYSHTEFLMVGRRWDIEIDEPFNFERPNWQRQLRDEVRRTAKRRSVDWIDYFAFTRGMYQSNVPPFVIGRVFWDHWLVWKALDSKKPVVDASAGVIAVHQNHDYDYHPQGKQGVWHGAESGSNHQLSGGWNHLRTIGDATEQLTENGLKRNSKRHWAAARRYVRQAGRVLLYDVWIPSWFLLLDVTRPLRRALGLRSEAFRRARQRL